MNPWQMTRLEYHNLQRASYLASEPEVSRAEYDECYPAGSHDGEWHAAIEQATRDGHVIPSNVIDDMVSEDGEDIVLRYFRGVNSQCLPSGYLPPSARAKINALGSAPDTTNSDREIYIHRLRGKVSELARKRSKERAARRLLQGY